MVVFILFLQKLTIFSCKHVSLYLYLIFKNLFDKNTDVSLSNIFSRLLLYAIYKIYKNINNNCILKIALYSKND